MIPFYLFPSFLGTLTIVAVVLLVLRRVRKAEASSGPHNPQLQVFVCREDAFTQLYLLASAGFFGAILLTLKTQLDWSLSWRLQVFLFSLYCLTIAYRLRAALLLSVGLLSFLVSLDAQAARWAEGQNIQQSSVLVMSLWSALLSYAAGKACLVQPGKKRFAMVYLLLGWLFIVGFAAIFSFKPGLALLQDYLKGDAFWHSPHLTFLMAALAAMVVLVIVRAVRLQTLSQIELVAIGLLAFLSAALLFAPSVQWVEGSGYDYLTSPALTSSGLVAAVFFNLLVFVLGVAMIFFGYQRQEEWPINLGAWLLFALLIFKYFDWFYSALDKSLFFVGAGILLLGVGGWLERMRQKIIRDLR